MRTLYLLRHAKSSWSDNTLTDHDRPLSSRGRRDAPRMAAFMASLGMAPDLVLCSTSMRTRQTLELLRQGLDLDAVEVSFEPAIYEVPPSHLTARVRSLPDDRKAVLVIGHNPGMQGAALDLIADGDPNLIRGLATKYPTCALAAISFDAASWADVRAASGRLDHFVRPADLPEGT